ncbi:hypothetical protein ACLEPN_30000 [Myxococcus sp. 1LA]
MSRVLAVLIGLSFLGCSMAYVAEDDVFVALVFNDSQFPAEAGRGSLVRALRDYRSAQAARHPTPAWND